MNPAVLHLLAAAAAQTEQPQGSPFGLLIPMTLFIVIFYFLMIRPQQKKQKEHQSLVASLQTGDGVVTSAGIHGTITNVKDATVLVRVADNVKIEFDRAAIVTVIRDGKATAIPKAS